MAKPTMAQMQAQHDAERVEIYEARDAAVNRANQKADEATARAREAEERAERMREQAVAVEEKLRTERHVSAAALRERDVLRGFIYREIPVKIDDLPASAAQALGILSGVQS